MASAAKPWSSRTLQPWTPLSNISLKSKYLTRSPANSPAANPFRMPLLNLSKTYWVRSSSTTGITSRSVPSRSTALIPSGTTQWEKRNLALEIPVWEPDLCIQCGKCSFVCPHAVIRQKVYDPAYLKDAPKTFKSMDARFFKEFPGKKFTIQVSPEDCTGCALCVENCPAKDKTNPARKAINMHPSPLCAKASVPIGNSSSPFRIWTAPLVEPNTVKNSQQLQPLFEFSGACAGCGETPYIKLLSQLFGDRALVANATGCSSIYGANLPTTPWTFNKDGRGPAWSNSLFEDNAEFGLGMRLTVDQNNTFARQLVQAIGQ